jgi:FkbM family methyltransferase
MKSIGELRSQAQFAVKLVRENPEASAHPIRFTGRLAKWRIMSALGRSAVVPFTRFGVSFYCPPEWHGNSKMAFLLRDGYERELPHLARWIQPTGVAVDVGAHYGVYTVALASIAEHVHAVEPSTHALAVLQRNVELNRLGNVTIHPCALGATEGHAPLFTHEDRSRASLNQFSTEQTHGESVPVRRLDDLIVGRVDLIKIDIEGYELPALEGATRILADQRPRVLFEFLPDAARRGGYDPHGVWDLLARLGYRFEQLTPDGVQESISDPEASTSLNVLALPM